MNFSQETRGAFSRRVRAGVLLFGLLGAALPGRTKSRQAFRADRMDTVLYGVAYYPEYMPYDRLDQDVQLMQKAGITVVRIGESSWGLWEPEDGKFEYAWMDRVVDKLHAAGIRIILGTPTYSIPAWMYKKHPEIVVTRLGGQYLYYGYRQNADLSNPTYQEFSSLPRPLALRDDPFHAGADNTVSEWAEMLIPDTTKPLAYYDHPFFGKYPAITRNLFGKGTLTYEGTVLSDKLQQSVLLDVLKLAGLTGPDQDLPAAIRVKHGSNRSGKTLHYYLNYSNDAQTFSYTYRSGMDLLSQAAVVQGQQIALKPWDAAIVEEK